MIREVCDLRVDGSGENPIDTSNPLNPDGQIELACVFDGNSRLTGIVDDNAKRTSFSYDALNRRVSQINADGEQYVYTHDRDDNRVQVVDPNGSIIDNTHDALNRLTRRDVTPAVGVVGTAVETYLYDGLGRRTGATDDNGSPETLVECSYVYDSLSRMWEEHQVVPTSPELPGSRYIRGDCDGDGFVGGSVNDMVFYVNWAFLGRTVPECLAACDADGDGFVGGSVNDVVYYANFAFLGREPPPPPFPECGLGDNDLDCASYPACSGEAGAGAGAEHVSVVSTVWSATPSG